MGRGDGLAELAEQGEWEREYLARAWASQEAEDAAEKLWAPLTEEF